MTVPYKLSYALLADHNTHANNRIQCYFLLIMYDKTSRHKLAELYPKKLDTKAMQSVDKKLHLDYTLCLPHYRRSVKELSYYLRQDY